MVLNLRTSFDINFKEISNWLCVSWRCISLLISCEDSLNKGWQRFGACWSERFWFSKRLPKNYAWRSGLVLETKLRSTSYITFGFPPKMFFRDEILPPFDPCVCCRRYPRVHPPPFAKHNSPAFLREVIDVPIAGPEIPLNEQIAWYNNSSRTHKMLHQGLDGTKWRPPPSLPVNIRTWRSTWSILIPPHEYNATFPWAGVTFFIYKSFTWWNFSLPNHPGPLFGVWLVVSFRSFLRGGSEGGLGRGGYWFRGSFLVLHWKVVAGGGKYRTWNFFSQDMFEGKLPRKEINKGDFFHLLLLFASCCCNAPDIGYRKKARRLCSAKLPNQYRRTRGGRARGCSVMERMSNASLGAISGNTTRCPLHLVQEIIASTLCDHVMYPWD